MANSYQDTLDQMIEEGSMKTGGPTTEAPLTDLDLDKQYQKTMHEGASEFAENVTFQSRDLNPGASAEAINIATESGADPGFVQDNLGKIKAARDQTMIDEFQKGNPRVGAWLTQSPYHASAAKEDLGALDLLGGIMDRASNYPRAAAAGVNRFNQAFWGLGEEVASLLPAYIGGGARKTFRQYRLEAEAVSAYTRGNQEGIGWFEQQVLSGTESMGAMLPAMTAAILTQNPNVMLGVMGAQTTGEAFGTGADAGLEPWQNLSYGLTQGGIEVLTEMAPAVRLMKGLKLREPLHRLLINQLASEIPGEQAATILQDLNDWAVLPTNKDKTFSDYINERPEAAAATLISTIVATAGMSGAGIIINDAANKREQTLQKDFFTALGEASEKSKTRSKLPQDYQDLVKHLTKDGPVRNAYIKKEAWDAYWTEKEEDPKIAFAEVMGDTTSYENLEDGHLVIPIEIYATKLAPTEHNAPLSENLKTAAENSTTAEAKAELKEKMENLKAALEKEDVDMPAVQDAGELVAGVTEQLVKTGRYTREEAQAQASIMYGGQMAAMIERAGFSPKEIMERYNLQIRATEETGLATMDAEGIRYDQTGELITDTPEFQAWIAGSQVPQVVYHGTKVQDPFTTFQTTAGDLGSHFGTDEQAGDRIGRVSGEGSIMPVYLNIKNPIRLKDTGHFHADRVIPQLIKQGLLTQDEADARFGHHTTWSKQLLEVNDEVVDFLQEKGYDGVVYLNRREGELDKMKLFHYADDYSEKAKISDEEFIKEFPDAKDSYIVFEPTQIKSVFAQRFDPTDPNILAQEREDLREGGLPESAANGLVQDSSGATVFNTEEAARGVGATEVFFQGVEEPTPAGRFMRGKAAKTAPMAYDTLAENITDDVIFDFDQDNSVADAKRRGAKIEHMTPTVQTGKKQLRHRTKNIEGYYGNAKMAFPNNAYPEGRNTYDIPGCGRLAWAMGNDVDRESACYGGACYAESLKALYQGKRAGITKGLNKTSASTAERAQVYEHLHKHGAEAAQRKFKQFEIKIYDEISKADRAKIEAEGLEAHPNFFKEKGVLKKVTVGRFKDAEGNIVSFADLKGFKPIPAVVSTNLQAADNQDIRLGVDTDGSAWLSDPSVMDAILAANPRSVSVYSSAYHTAPAAHELAGRTIINVTVSGWHPLAETFSRLRWAEEARANGWNVILREVVADPAIFEQDMVDVYNRLHDALLKTDFFIMQQALHIGKKTSPTKEPFGLPGCCVGSKKNPGTCDACEVSEGLGRRFQNYWDIAQSDRREEQILPDVDDRNRQVFEQAETPFYSQLQRVVEGEKFPPKASGEVMMNIINKSAVKKDEIKWSGVQQFLEGKKQVTKQELLDHLMGNETVTEETVLIAPGTAVEGREKLKEQYVEEMSKRYEVVVEEGEPLFGKARYAFSVRQPDGEPMYNAEGDLELFGSESEAREEIDYFLRAAANALPNETLTSEIYGEEYEGYVRYATHLTLKHGTNYQERLFQLPSIGVPTSIDQRIYEAGWRLTDKGEGKGWELRDDNDYIIAEGATKESLFERADLSDLPYREGDAFTGGHYGADYPNVFAHTRHSTFTDTEGNKVLFIQEIQSDWMQEAREKGFKELSPEDQAKKDELSAKVIDLRNQGDAAFYAGKPEESEAIGKKIDALMEELNPLITQSLGGVPAAPLLKNWHEFVMKSMIRVAAEQGFDKIAWASGEQTQDLYDLSRQIKSIQAMRHARPTKPAGWSLEVTTKEGTPEQIYATDEKLPDYVGKELADKIIQDAQDVKTKWNKAVKEATALTKAGKIEEADAVIADPKHTELAYQVAQGVTYSGLDLKVGGEWAINLYDKMVPMYLKKFTKQFGGKVETSELIQIKGEQPAPFIVYGRDGEFVARATTKERAEFLASDVKGRYEEGGVISSKQQSLEITPELRDAALEGEFPLYQAEPIKPKKGVVRAKVAFGPAGEIDLTLLSQANRSSFFHETGHIYLKIMSDLVKMEGSSKEIKADLKMVLDWLEVPGKNLAERTRNIKREHHEKFARGFELYYLEGKAPNTALRAAFARFQEWLVGIYRTIERFKDIHDIELNEEVRTIMARMSASQVVPDVIQGEIDAAIVDLVAEGKELNKITQQNIDKMITPAAKRTVKGTILEAVGKRRPAFKMIGEDQAMRAAWKKAEQEARKAFKAGKETEGLKWKEKMKNVILRADEKVAKIQTEKQKMAKRRKTLKTIKDYLGLTDAQMKKLSHKRNVGNMTDYEFKKFKDRMLIQAEQLQELDIQKHRVVDIIRKKRLDKVDNYRKALKLPVIHNMSRVQLEKFADLLEEFEDGDVFMTPKRIDAVNLAGIPGETWRQAREALAKKFGLTYEELAKVKVSELDEYRWDSALAEQNPFYSVLVEEVLSSGMEADIRYRNVEKDIHALSKKSEKSRGLSLTRMAIPQDKDIMAYLEAEEDMKQNIMKHMTGAQIDLAHYMQEYYAEALEYLIKSKSLQRGRDNYMVHLRRSLLENIKEDGILKATRQIFKNYELDEMGFTILDEATNTILPLNKFFQFSMRRTGELGPSYNVVKSFLVYVKALEKKKHLDQVIPTMDTYAQVLSPQGTTKEGLKTDRTLHEFVKKWINNKKGRQIRWPLKQGGKLDLIVNTTRSFVSLLYLGGKFATQIGAFAGEQTVTTVMLGPTAHVRGTKRMVTKKGRAILEKYSSWTGRSIWQEFFDPGQDLSDRLMQGVFAIFHESTVLANKQFLLASLTEEEYNSGIIRASRLAEMKIDMGRFRPIPGSASLAGSTAVGKVGTQFKTWAFVVAHSVSKDLKVLTSDLANRKEGALTTREAREIYRIVLLMTSLYFILGLGDDDDDRGFRAELSRKIRRESFTVIQAMDPGLLLHVPATLQFISRLSKNWNNWTALQKQLTPAAVKQFKKEE